MVFGVPKHGGMRRKKTGKCPGRGSIIFMPFYWHLIYYFVVLKEADNLPIKV